MKRVMNLCCLVMILGICNPLLLQAQFSAGDGTAQNPFIILDASDLQNMALDLDAHYALGADIDASVTSSWNGGLGFVPVGGGRSPFTGSLDGRGFTILGLTIQRPDTDNVGLFGELANGTVKNLFFSGSSVTGGNYTGTVVGRTVHGGTVENIYVNGMVSGSSSTGGVVGFIFRNGTINEAQFHGTISGGTMAGGIVGSTEGNEGFTLTKSLATGTVSATSDGGGVVGRIDAAGPLVTFSQNAFIGSVTTTQAYAGGLIGRINISEVTLSNSFAWGTVSGDDAVGGLIGRISATSGQISHISTSYAANAVTATTNRGGVLGQGTNLHTFSSVYWDTELSGIFQATGTGSSEGATGRNTANMKSQATFTSFDFETIWIIVEGTGYPLLRGLIRTDVDMDPPTDLVVLPMPGVNQVSWVGSPLAEGYVVMRGESSDIEQAMPVAVISQTFYHDFFVSPGITYHYWVIAGSLSGSSSAPAGPVSVETLDLTGELSSGSATLTAVTENWSKNWDYFDFSRGEVSTVNSEAGFVADIRGTSNEGVNFGNEYAPEIEGRRVFFLGYGDIGSVRHVPYRVDAEPWMFNSWELDFMPLKVGQLWVVFTSEDDYAIMEITDVPDDHGDEFSFDFNYNAGGSPVFGASTRVPAGIQIISGNNQHGEQNSALPQPFLVQVIDAEGNGVPGVIVHFSVTDSPLGPNYWGGIDKMRVVSDEEGYAAATLTTRNMDGFYHVRASLSHLPIGANFTAYVGPVSIETGTDGPNRIELGQNYPNPFNPVSIVPFSVSSHTQVKI